MTLREIKGYVLVIFSGAMLLAAAILLVLQWGNRCQFSLFGYPYDIFLVENRLRGGVNTALLMGFSAIGGILIALLGKVLIAGLRALRAARRQAQPQQPPPKVTA